MPRHHLRAAAIVLILVLVARRLRGCGDSDVGPHGWQRGRRQDTTETRRAQSLAKRSINQREGCATARETILGRVSSVARLSALRAQLQAQEVDAFYVPSGDSHQSEYIADADKRRQWISGFSGSAGLAVVTKEKAALWTDGRYYLSAEQELDCNWLFMKGQEHDDTAWIQWLASELRSGSKVGADPSLTGASVWLEQEAELAKYGIKMVPLYDNPIDAIWTEDRPPRSAKLLEIISDEIAGESWQKKLADLRSDLTLGGHAAIVLTALDEIAWQFNLRGKDIPYNPVFRAYAVVTQEDVILYLPPEKQTTDVREHLKSQDCVGKECVIIKDYLTVFDELPSLARPWKSILLGKKWAYTGGASYAIYNLIPDKDKVVFENSPVMLRKGRKNPVEIAGMMRANIRDAVVVMEMASQLAEQVPAGVGDWDEYKVSAELVKLRRMQDLSRGPSFATIAAYGANGAIIHYKPKENATSIRKLGTNSLLLMDSGGQYLDGTTDTTRTFHYGQPSDFEREAYTRVLMGAIDLARATFPAGTPDTRVDILTRSHLLRVGLNYRHGTGHGIGAYGFIHESPVQVRLYAKEEHPFAVGQFFSDEPGYYEPGSFGIRLETVLRVVDKTTQLIEKKRRIGTAQDYGTFLGFEPVCLVPFEPRLIDHSLMSEGQIDWLNWYNSRIREQLGPELKNQRKERAFAWMIERTEPISGSNFSPLQSSGKESLRKISKFTLILMIIFVSQLS